MKMKMLMPAENIPLGQTVTKKNGEKPYTIRDCVKIYGDADPNRQRELKADDGTRFLISESGDINVINGDVELVWIVDDYDLYRFLYQIVEKQPFPED